ncbi:MAG TPA: LlaJI family restriction endonuclease [Methanosphaera sp.]|nr:LlaJI family restriction endonuclease [Methanosphaera sp.]
MKLLDLNDLFLTNEKLEDLGDKEYILYQIRNELNTQFNTRKQIILKAFYTYISQNNHAFNDYNTISMYGTSSFNMV